MDLPFVKIRKESVINMRLDEVINIAKVNDYYGFIKQDSTPDAPDMYLAVQKHSPLFFWNMDYVHKHGHAAFWNPTPEELTATDWRWYPTIPSLTTATAQDFKTG